ncbi:MAG TPA: catalase [Planctomycetota bacterium]|nr:catalase [Planctomycetota bacterium]
MSTRRKTSRTVRGKTRRAPAARRPVPAGKPRPDSDELEPPSEERLSREQAASKPLRRQSKDTALEAFRERFGRAPLTTDQGIPVQQTDDSLKAGPRGPTLLEDFHLREKIMHFDHERIPERVVHARGSGAHGFFQVYEPLAELTSAEFLNDPSARTPVFVRFSTVVGSRGSSDLARDVRGFATRFYTREGNFDLVGNNMPVFFIQDGIKFPDLVHAVKPEPHHEMPQAASAHDTFWDFVSLVPETLHMVMWLMSDRAIPRSFRMMEGFGVHTFRLVAGSGRTSLVKFHWKPVLGAHSIVWDEAQKISGRDPDFHRRDLWEAIERGQYPEYELGLQVMDEDQQLAFGFDLLDATKLVPEELVPVRRVGRMVLDRNPTNFFAETEQVAFCIGNVVPGIDFTNDPLLQARLFSYLDTQLLRLGGPNFTELPINRPLAPVSNHQQDGLGRQSIHTARALYHPNSIANNHPRPARVDGFVHVPEPVRGAKVRQRSDSFLDHFSQARLFLHSQSAPEREHLVEACRFEIGKVERLAIRERVVALFAEIDAEFAAEVATMVGVKPVKPARQPPVAQPTGTPPPSGGPAKGHVTSPALSLLNQPHDSARTRKVAVLAAPGARALDLEIVEGELAAAGVLCEVVSLSLGPFATDEGRPCEAQKTFLTTDSVLYDGVYVAGGADSVASLLGLEQVRLFLGDAFRHAKPIGATNEGVELLGAVELPQIELAHEASAAETSDRGVVSAWTDGAGGLQGFAAAFVDALAQHRHFDRPRSQLRPQLRNGTETA